MSDITRKEEGDLVTFSFVFPDGKKYVKCYDKSKCSDREKSIAEEHCQKEVERLKKTGWHYDDERARSEPNHEMVGFFMKCGYCGRQGLATHRVPSEFVDIYSPCPCLSMSHS